MQTSLEVKGVTFTVPSAASGVRISQFVQQEAQDIDGDAEKLCIIYSALLWICAEPGLRIRRLTDSELHEHGDSYYDFLSDDHGFTLRDIITTAQTMLERIVDIGKHEDSKTVEKAADFLASTP